MKVAFGNELESLGRVNSTEQLRLPVERHELGQKGNLKSDLKSDDLGQTTLIVITV